MTGSRKNPSLFVSATCVPKVRIINPKVDCGLPLVIKSSTGNIVASELVDLHRSVHKTDQPLRKSIRLVVLR